MLSDCLGLWKKVFQSPQCNSELIPEWYYLPQIYKNKNFCYFGRDNRDNVVSDVILPKWANDNPFYYCMKFREFIENTKYTKILNHWIDMVFGKRQQNTDDKNIYFSFATQDYYDKTQQAEVSRMALKSASEFFQLPKQLFVNNHKMLGNKDQSDNIEEIKGSSTKLNLVGVEEVNKEEIKIIADECVSNISYRKENPFRYMSIITGSLKNHEDSFYLLWKVNKLMPLLSVEKYKKEKSDPTFLERVIFEVDFPNEYVLPSNYVSQFTIQGKDYMVVGRLFTSKFAVVNLDGGPMKSQYYGLDTLTTLISAIHCTRDGKTIIAGYQSGTIGIWSIYDTEDSKFSAQRKRESAFAFRNNPFKRLYGDGTNMPPFIVEFKTLCSSSNADGCEIVSIDANCDLGVFVAVTKNMTVTVHSIETGECLNWIKLTSERRFIHGIQLSKNGYFVLATCGKDGVEASSKKSQAESRRYMCSTLQTFGINGECITPKPYILSDTVKGMMIKERTIVKGRSAEQDAHQDQSKKIFERLMDDKIFFFDSNNGFIMNCIDHNECYRIPKEDDEERKDAKSMDKQPRDFKFRSLFLNSYKILAQGVDKRDDFRQVIHQTFEPLNRKWNDISDRLIM